MELAVGVGLVSGRGRGGTKSVFLYTNDKIVSVYESAPVIFFRTLNMLHFLLY